MNSWVERYVTAVVGNLPENERTEVERELTSNIYDMLSENPSEEEIKQVLQELGSPAELAEEYRQNPRYLISPQIYGDYIRLLKYLVPAIVLIVAVVGAIIGGIEALQQNPLQVEQFIELVLSDGLSSGISAGLQTIVWVTVGFVIAERTGAIPRKQKEEWSLEDLPKEKPGKKIPLSDPIVEIVATLFFCGLLVLEIFGRLPLAYFTSENMVDNVPLFSPSFGQKLLPVLVIGIVLTIIANFYKIVDRRWTVRVGLWTVLDNVISAIMWVVVLLQGNVFSPEIIALLKEQTWSNGDVLHYISKGNMDGVVLVIIAIIVIVTICESIAAVVHTVKNKNLTIML